VNGHFLVGFIIHLFRFLYPPQDIKIRPDPIRLSPKFVIKRATSLAAMARPHVVVVPYPGSGNINPALQLAKLLHRHGVYVTFVNTEHNHRRVQATEGAGAVRGREGFRFEAIPDGLSEADRGKQDYLRGLAVSTSTRCAAPLRDLIARGAGARHPDHGVLDRQRRSAHDAHEAPGARGTRIPATQG
jgi:hypothetical protein